MFTQTIHNRATIRFRRWSRKSYAVFISLSCAVSIGMLAVSISNKMLQKSTVAIKLNKTESTEHNYPTSDTSDIDETSILELNIQHIITEQDKSVAAAAGITCINIFTKTVEVGTSYFNRFYF